MEFLMPHINSWVALFLLVLGLVFMVVRENYFKKLIALSIFQVAVLLFYISAGYVAGARFPIIKTGVSDYVNPLPHVLMLTAIVVGVATLAVGLALVVRIKESLGTVEDDEVFATLREGLKKKQAQKKTPRIKTKRKK